MPIVTNGSCRIYWRGDGDTTLPALVLGNSLGTDHSLWDPMLQALMKDFYVVRYDMRGHGGSEAPQGDYSLTQLTDDAQAVIAAARLSSYDFWGISLGGMVGMELAARKPTGLRHVVLSNTAAEFDAGIWDARMAALKQGGMPEGVNPLEIFNLSEPDMKLFDSFSKQLQEKIMQSPEWQKISHKGGFEVTTDDDFDINPVVGIDDDIPF